MSTWCMPLRWEWHSHSTNRRRGRRSGSSGAFRRTSASRCGWFTECGSRSSLRCILRAAGTLTLRSGARIGGWDICESVPGGLEIHNLVVIESDDEPLAIYRDESSFGTQTVDHV